MCRLAVPLLLALGAAACSKSSEAESNADEYFYDCEDPGRPAGLTVFATDEAFREYGDKIAATGLQKSDAQAPQLTTPATGSALSIATPPVFSFTSGMAVRLDRATPGRPLPRPRGRWAWLKEALALEGTAWAHCPNVTGSLYLVQVTAAGATEPAYTALASVTSFTPKSDVWKAKLQGLSGKQATVTVARGIFSMGHLELGPFVATKDATFTVGP
jgi:hypothetical protein